MLQVAHAVAARGPSWLAVGFGITVAMWGVGYVGRLPGVLLPGPLLLSLLLVCFVAGGIFLGRHAGRDWRDGAVAGLFSGLLNLLVLGSLLSGDRPNELLPSALWWVPGSLVLAALLSGFGGAAGARFPRRDASTRDWPAAFAKIAVVATLLLVAVGGVVTGTDSGLAVVDWPNSYGYNMFLYPLSRMTGGIYYEHAHRLFGALVGLTTVALALLLQRADPRAWVRRLGWVAVAMVVVQGILGGLRVTGRFTLSTAAETMEPSLALAMVHGVLAQLFLATLVALGVFTSGTWRGDVAPLRRPAVRADRALAVTLVALLVFQLVLGAAQRHFQVLLVAHVLLGVAMIAPLVFHVGIRALVLNPGQPSLRRSGLLLVGAVVVQVGLGILAFLARPTSGGMEIVVTTVHQWFGAVLLALAVMLACLTFRLLDTAD